jgi:hypothetical protein
MLIPYVYLKASAQALYNPVFFENSDDKTSAQAGADSWAAEFLFSMNYIAC